MGRSPIGRRVVASLLSSGKRGQARCVIVLDKPRRNRLAAHLIDRPLIWADLKGIAPPLK
jgi:hypothetical protein